MKQDQVNIYCKKIWRKMDEGIVPFLQLIISFIDG
jgi:hypothetical protein